MQLLESCKLLRSCEPTISLVFSLSCLDWQLDFNKVKAWLAYFVAVSSLKSLSAGNRQCIHGYILTYSTLSLRTFDCAAEGALISALTQEYPTDGPKWLSSVVNTKECT